MNMENDKYIMPTMPLPDTPFRLPMFGGIVPPRPDIIHVRNDDILSAKTPEPKRIKVLKGSAFLFGIIWDKADRILNIFISVLWIKIPIPAKKCMMKLKEKTDNEGR